MKKPEFKKTFTRSKETPSRGGVSSPRKFDRQASKPSYSAKKFEGGGYSDKKVSPSRFEKPVYKGKEDRLAGTRTRNETRTYSGYSTHTPDKKSSRAYTKPHASIMVASETKLKANASLPSSGSLRGGQARPLPTLASSGSLRSQASRDTSWGGVADWYNKHLEKGDDTYHTKVVFPNILRMLGDVTGKKVLDMACGQGIFAEQLRDKGAFVTGVDVAKELIKIAEEKSKTVQEKGTHKVVYHVASADDLFMLKNASYDVVVCILALQNIEDLQKTISEAKRVLTKNGVFIFVLNHPSYRNPKQTYWGYNEADNTQYRRVDEYMSESHVRIDMTPGSEVDKKFTVSFHRPLQVYIKALHKNGLALTRLEEWVSHRESERGPKKKAEDKARKEIPLFMCIESVVIGDKA
jgi:ubiquinone/menaquinone biosynthesis C-methylase UbiE